MTTARLASARNRRLFTVPLLPDVHVRPDMVVTSASDADVARDDPYPVPVVELHRDQAHLLLIARALGA